MGDHALDYRRDYQLGQSAAEFRALDSHFVPLLIVLKPPCAKSMHPTIYFHSHKLFLLNKDGVFNVIMFKSMSTAQYESYILDKCRSNLI